jgi:hypothetical protein
MLWLCAMLPISGLAASGLTGQCPMQIMANGDGNSMSADMPDCDTMQSTPSTDKTKHPSCKVTAQCQMGSLYHPVSAPVAHRPAGLVSPVIFYYAQSLIVHTPDGLWRPPRSL